ncbi:IS66 family insertion sequence element accessory protein TnpB [Pseudomonas arsenicoxydans]|uniref:IS66 family insertion sequence element accessory protein TnpB n=1 Tax=Pseudomonas arsenicoxydans TaxID=702115 RepID=UPI0021C747B3|nr:IS66 family insertion sequence element accessory protein TnpB [Pseudomonas arsenicoxydans]
MLCSRFPQEPARHDATGAKVEKVYLYPKPVDFRKSIDGLAALVELDIKVAVFDPVLFVFLNKPHNRVKDVVCRNQLEMVFCLHGIFCSLAPLHRCPCLMNTHSPAVP